MNKYQRLVLTVALINIVVLAMFPPFADVPLARGAFPSFDGFYPLFSRLGRQPLHQGLLMMEVTLIAANALGAWLILEIYRKEDFQTYRHGLGIAVFAVLNIIVMLSFPPFVQYSTLLKSAAPSFDSFYFVFGPRSARPVLTSLLYLEIIFVLINALSIYLLFNIIRRSEDAARDRLLAMAEHMTDSDLAKLSDAMRKMVVDHREQSLLNSLGRKTDRRKGTDPNYTGPERRRGNRRHLR